jgi:hypothetical protein
MPYSGLMQHGMVVIMVPVQAFFGVLPSHFSISEGEKETKLYS